MGIKTSKSIPLASLLPDPGHAGGCNPGVARVGENVGESNKSIPGYRWYPPENASKLIPKCNDIPLSCALFFLRRPTSCRLFRPDSPCASARNERATLELGGGFSRGNTAHRSNDYILHTTYLYISPSIFTHGDRLAWIVMQRPCDTQPSPAAI